MGLSWSVGGRILRWSITTVATVGALYAMTGRWDLPWVWAMAAASCLAGLAMFLTIDPELARERRRPGPGGVDRISQLALGPVMAVQVLIACLDVGRFHWSDTVPTALRAVSLLLFSGGFGLVIWSVAVNRFFSSVVRIQSDRGHTIIRSGPYRYVRHPGYVGMLLSYPVVSLEMGSWWALLPGLLCSAIVLRRAVLEDAYLRAHLAGYLDYAAAVPNRLVPGVW